MRALSAQNIGCRTSAPSRRSQVRTAVLPGSAWLLTPPSRLLCCFFATNNSSLKLRDCVAAAVSSTAVASGGFMHGCKGGHWVMGTSHSSSFLPPTLVRDVVFVQ